MIADFANYKMISQIQGARNILLLFVLVISDPDKIPEQFISMYVHTIKVNGSRKVRAVKIFNIIA